MTHPFHIVDVFAERPYAGNQLAVVTHADDLSDETMQQIATEMNFSETTFVYTAPERDGGHRVRIFTPAREIAFAGHPILGTAWVIREQIAPGTSAPVRLNLAVGQVPVTFELAADEPETAWFQAPQVTSGATCDRKPMATALGISPDDIETASPIQQMTAGISAMIVPLRSLDALRRCKLDLDAFAPLARQGFPRSCTCSAAKRITPATTCASGSFSRPTAYARIRRRATEPPSSAPISWNIRFSPDPACRCALNRDTK